jgi:hypothetical protein
MAFADRTLQLLHIARGFGIYCDNRFVRLSDIALAKNQRSQQRGRENQSTRDKGTGENRLAKVPLFTIEASPRRRPVGNHSNHLRAAQLGSSFKPRCSIAHCDSELGHIMYVPRILFTNVFVDGSKAAG